MQVQTKDMTTHANCNILITLHNHYEIAACQRNPTEMFNKLLDNSFLDVACLQSHLLTINLTLLQSIDCTQFCFKAL